MNLVSLAPANTQILLDLGLEKDIAACTRFCPAFPGRDKLVAGGWLDVDTDKIAAMHPGLVLTSHSLQDAITHQLMERNVPVVQLNPKNFHDILESYLAVGKLVGCLERAQEKVTRMSEQFNEFLAKTKGVEKIPAYIEEWPSPPMASGNWVPDIANAAGFQTLLNAGEPSREVSLDELKQFAPRLIILSWCGYGDKADPGKVRARDGWLQLAPVKENRVHVLHDDCLNAPDSRLLKGLQELFTLRESLG